LLRTICLTYFCSLALLDARGDSVLSVAPRGAIGPAATKVEMLGFSE
jgi:hypothetical protein